MEAAVNGVPSLRLALALHLAYQFTPVYICVDIEMSSYKEIQG